ncbi:twin-arginine translocation pathway signal [Moniliophthora roreri]|nr:twin-arginine translocation pathway signal [Moniliophthora roreri]
MVKGLGSIPEIGGILAGIVGALWPDTPEDVWSKVRAEVEALIGQKIDEAVYSLIAAKLPGLGDASKLYLKLVAGHGTGDAIRTQWVATNTVYTAAASEFQNPKFEWVLGPLFAIFSVLHMTLLRDAVLYGQKWGWSPDDYKVYVQFTKDTLDKYLAYYDKVLKNRYNVLAPGQPAVGSHNIDNYQYWQEYNQQLVVAFDDYRVLVRYLDPIQHPDATKPTDLPFQDAYSLAYGTADDWDGTASLWSGSGVGKAYSTPLTGIREIYIELFNYGPRVLQVRHDAGTGPLILGDPSRRVDQYGIIADPQQGKETKTTKLKTSPDYTYSVKGAKLRSGSIPLALSLLMYDDSEEWLYDKFVVPGAQHYTVKIEGRMLTTLNMWTTSKFYDYNLACIIFGFSRDPKYLPPTAGRILYITSINELPPELKNQITVTPELEAERKAYWNHINSY